VAGPTLAIAERDDERIGAKPLGEKLIADEALRGEEDEDGGTDLDRGQVDRPAGFDTRAARERHRGEDALALGSVRIAERPLERLLPEGLVLANVELELRRAKGLRLDRESPRRSPRRPHGVEEPFREPRPILARAVVVFSAGDVPARPRRVDLKDLGPFVARAPARKAGEIGAHLALAVVAHRMRGVG